MDIRYTTKGEIIMTNFTLLLIEFGLLLILLIIEPFLIDYKVMNEKGYTFFFFISLSVLPFFIMLDLLFNIVIYFS